MAYLWAPARYRWTDLLNSDCHDHRGSGRREDRLEVDAWLRTFLERCGFAPRRLPGAAGREELRILRSDMARVAFAVAAGEEPRPDDLARLNRHLRRAGSHPTIVARGRAFELREARAGPALDRVIGALAVGFAETLAQGDLERIKTCANPDCRWIMVDESRNRSRRWCEASACGNLVNVRASRRRRRERLPGEGTSGANRDPR